jgi:hypothetical protein
MSDKEEDGFSFREGQEEDNTHAQSKAAMPRKKNLQIRVTTEEEEER